MAVNYACHRYHWPKPEDADAHHVVPRAWQNFWAPDGEPAGLAGAQVVDVKSRPVIRWMEIPTAVLWHAETILLTPSCHRAVHGRISALMKGFAASPGRRTEPEGDVLNSVLRELAPTRGKLWEIAIRAPHLFTAAGGSINALCDARQWGDS